MQASATAPPSTDIGGVHASTSVSPATDIVALGEAMIEFNEARAGDAHAWLQGFGGDTSNMAIAAARLGARSGYATRVGNDSFGRRLIDLWKREGVAVDGVTVDADAPTGVYFVSHDESGHAFSYLRAGSAASRMAPATLPLEAIRATRVLHLSGISQAISSSACDACFAAIDVARAAGARVSYDTNLRLALWPLARARAVVRETLRLADWALPGLDDARHLFDTEDPAHIVGICHELGASWVVLKLGRNGCVVSDGRRREHVAGATIDAVDATGAGDCFDGAFAARVTAGDDPFAAARFANAAAAIATTGYGAVAPLPRVADVERLLAAAAT